MKTISLHDLIIELKKKKINLGSDPKATVSMYSEMGIIPPPKITARPDSDLEPEVSYPVDTIDKIIEIKELKNKGLELDEIKDSYALDYVRDTIKDILATEDKAKLKQLAELLSQGSDQLTSILEAPLLKVIETNNSKELSKLLSLFAGQSFYSILESNTYLEQYNVNEARKSAFRSMFYLSIVCLKLARKSKDKILEDAAFETYNQMVMGPIEKATKKVQEEFRASLKTYMKSKKTG